MNGIYFKEGTYVVIDNDTENDICLFNLRNKNTLVLYGSRVSLSTNYNRTGIYFSIDGRTIIKMKYTKWSESDIRYDIEEILGFREVVSHLNAIETNGVDAFLENYKKSIEFLYSELKYLHQKTELEVSSESDNTKIEKLLLEVEKIRKLLLLVLTIMFNLYTYMTSGLENEKVLSVCQSIMDSIS